jgi:hypothetical protein
VLPTPATAPPSSAPAPSAPAEHDTAPVPPYPSGPEFYEGLRAQPEPPPVGRRQSLVGALLAIAGVLVGIVLLYAFRHDGDPGQGPVVALPTATHAVTHAPSPTPKASARPSATPSVAPSSPAAVVAPVRPVLVLNNSRIQHLADRSAARFRAGGWPVSGTGNYRGGIISRTTVYYAPGQLGSAQRFAKQFSIPRVLPRFSGLPGSGLTVVLTRDYG